METFPCCLEKPPSQANGFQPQGPALLPHIKKSEQSQGFCHLGSLGPWRGSGCQRAASAAPGSWCSCEATQPGPVSLPHLLLCSSSGCGERRRLGKEAGSRRRDAWLFCLSTPCSFSQGGGRTESQAWPSKLDKHTARWLGLCARAYPKPQAKPTHLPGPSSWGAVNSLTLR